MRYMVKHLSRYLNRLNRWYSEKKKEYAIKNENAENNNEQKARRCGKICFCRCCGDNKLIQLWKYYGNYLFMMYVIVKLIYILNILLQLHLLNLFLGMDYHMYGFQVMSKMFAGQNWSTSDKFPRVTLCDFSIRVLGNMHKYTVQCSLPMNLFNEIIFIFIWFWFFFVGVVSVCSLLLWLKASVYMPTQRKEIKRRLMAKDMIEHDQKLVKKFVYEYLKRDGCFILKLVTRNASDLVASELVSGLWDQYLDNVKRFNAQQSVETYSQGNDEKSVLIDQNHESKV